MHGEMINMEKEILNEILRIRLLSNYDMKSTLTENEEIILKEGKGETVVSTIKTVDDIAKIERQLLAASENELRTALNQGKKLTITAKDGITLLKTTDEIIGALKAGKLAPAEAGKVYRNAFRNTTDIKLLQGIADKTVEGTSFISKYGNLNKSEFISRVTKDMKIGPQQAEALFKSNTKRLSNLGNVGKNTGKNAGKNAGKNSQNINININNNVKNMSNAEYAKYLDGYADDLYRVTGKDADELARNSGFKNFEDWGRRDPDGLVRVIESETRSGTGFFGRLFSKGRRWATVWSIVKWGALAVGAYWLYKKLFGDDAPNPCDPGTHMVEGKGCLPDPDPKPEPEPVVTDTTTIKGGGGGGENYIECEPPYYKGCIGKKGDDNIKKAQDCLGVTPNGFFNQETEDALKNKINKKSFTSSDMSAICAKSYGGGSFQI
jgi:hypothetical protein